MPVVVTGADLPRGRAVVEALLAAGVPEVRALVGSREAQRDLVARGVRTSRVGVDDPAGLAAVLLGAHTLVHLDGDAALLAGALPAGALAAGALAGSGLRRVVLLQASPELRHQPGLEVVIVQDGPGLADAVLEADGRG